MAQQIKMLPIKPAGLCSVTKTHIVGKNPLLKVVLSPTRVPFHTYTHRGTYMLIILYSCLNCKTQKASAWKWQSAVVSDITLVQTPSPHQPCWSDQQQAQREGKGTYETRQVHSSHSGLLPSPGILKSQGEELGQFTEKLRVRNRG